MLRLRVVLGLVAIMLVMGGWLSGQDKQDTAIRVRGQLPQYWKKLNLTEEQKKRVVRIQTEYGAKIDALKEQINKLDQQMRAEREKVLTETQKAMLREIIASRVGGAGSGKNDKKDQKQPEKQP